MILDDTIVAISSPPGSAPRGIIRLSGPRAIDITDTLFQSESSKPLSSEDTRAYVAGTIRVGPTRLPGAVYLFRTPHSYTRQDIVELHLLGAPGVLAIVMEDLLAAGARSAQPGEFTARAFLAGAMDFSQVHGVAGLIAARSDDQLQAAERLLHGALSQTALAAREELADLLSLVEGALDFADEPVEFITPAQLKSRLESVHRSLSATAAASLRAERFDRLPTVVLTGPPNVGKSSLLNRLTGMDRAICTPIAGTTRDVLSAPLKLNDMECLLIDVAGREEAQDMLDAKAQAAAAQALKDADLILHVIDVTQELPQVDPTADHAPAIIVANKFDLFSQPQRSDAINRIRNQSVLPVCPVSATTGEGCEDLKSSIQFALQGRTADVGDSTIALMTEHRDALDRALSALEKAQLVAENCGQQLEDADLVAAELRIAADALGHLVGQDAADDLLGRIFSRFCIGK